MSPATYVILSGILTYGAPLALAVYEIWSLRRSLGGGDGPPPAPETPRAPKPLPNCLLPQPVVARGPVRMRELEDA